MSVMADASRVNFAPAVTARRVGDPARIVASGELAARDLDWKMRHTLSEMAQSAWTARIRAAGGPQWAIDGLAG
jgi:UDP-glucose 4-epimerase